MVEKRLKEKRRLNLRAKLTTGEEVELSQTDIIKDPQKFALGLDSLPPEHPVSLEGKTKDGRDWVRKEELDPASFYKPKEE